MKETIIMTVCLITIIFLSIGLGYMARDDISSILNKINSEDITAPEECENLSMRETAYCLNDYVEKIYKYKETKDNQHLTLEELKEEGGDCLNWAELYDSNARELGFNSEIIIIDTENKTKHAFTTISDNTGYCILDQTQVRCLGLGA